jgi:hypothetical protein
MVRRTLWSRAKPTAFWTSATVLACTIQSGPAVPLSFLKIPGNVDFQTPSAGHPLSEANSLQPAGASEVLAYNCLSGVGGKIALCCKLGAAKSAAATHKSFMATLGFWGNPLEKLTSMRLIGCGSCAKANAREHSLRHYTTALHLAGKIAIFAICTRYSIKHCLNFGIWLVRRMRCTGTLRVRPVAGVKGCLSGTQFQERQTSILGKVEASRAI